MVVTCLTRQREVAISLFENYDKALALENSALNSNGKAMQKYAVYQDSIAAKQDRINALAQTWVQNMNFEWVIGELLSLGEAFMKVFSNKLVVQVGMATAAILAFVKAARSLVLMGKLFMEMRGIVSTGTLLTQVLGAAGIGTVLPVVVALTIAITGLVYIIDKFHHSAAELAQELQGLDNEIDSSQSEIDEYKSKIAENDKKIQELQDTINKGIGGLVEQDELDRLKEENKQLERQISLEQKRLDLVKEQRKQTAEELYGKKFRVGRYSVGYGRNTATKDVRQYGSVEVAPEDVIATYQKQIDNLRKEYEKAADNNNEKLAKTIEAKINELESELTNTVVPQLELLREYYPEIAEVLDAYYDSLLSYGEKFKSASEKLDPTTQINLANLANAIKQQDDLNTKMEQYGSQIDLNNRKMLETSKIDSKIAEEMGDGYATLFSRTYTEQDFGGKGTGAILVTPILPNGEVFEDWETLESYIESLMVDGKIDVSKDTEGVIMGIFDEGDLEASITKADEFGNAAHEANAAVEELASTLGLEGFTGTLDSLYDALENTKNEALRTFIDELKAGGFTIQQIIQQMVELKNVTQKGIIKLETPAAQIGRFKDKVKSVVAAEEELAETGYVSADAAADLAEAYGEEVYDAMVWTSKGYKISRSELEALIEKQKENYILALNDAKRAAAAVIEANGGRTISWNAETTAILANIKAVKAAKIQQLAYMRGADAATKEVAMAAYNEIKDAEDSLANAQENYDNLLKTLAYLRTSTTTKTSGKSDAETAYEREIRLLEHELYLSQQIADIYKGDNDEANYRAEVNKQMAIYLKLMEAAHAEAERLRRLGYAETSEEIQNLQQAWWGYYNARRDLETGLADWEKEATDSALGDVKSAIDDLLNEAEDKLNDKLDELEYRIKKNEAIKALHEAFFGILNEVADGLHEIDKELEASLSSADYLDESLRNAMFNEDDYNKMSAKLKEIASDSKRLFDDYLNQLEMLTEDEIYKADYITSEFERQYKYKELEYDIAEKELALAKAQTKLQNTLMNRNVRMYKNGQWIWTADYTAVEEAKKAVRDAEYEKRDAEIKLKQQEIIDKYEGIIDNLKMQKDAAQAEFDALKKMWERIQADLEDEEDAMTRLLKSINDTDIPAFKQIIAKVGEGLRELLSSLGFEIPQVEKNPYGAGTDFANEEKYLKNLIATGNYGQQEWAKEQLKLLYGTFGVGNVGDTGGYTAGTNFANEEKYLNNLIATGNYGQREWAKAQLEKLHNAEQVHGTGSSGGGGSGGGGGTSGGGGGGNTSSGNSGKSNQQRYLENLVATGNYGQKEWAKDQLNKGLYDSGGVLEGTGGIKATVKDETVFGPELSSKLLSPQKSKEFLNSATALTKILDNSSALSSILNRFAGLVSNSSSVANDSHDVYFNGNPLGGITRADSVALTSILRRYIPISGGGR